MHIAKLESDLLKREARTETVGRLLCQRKDFILLSLPLNLVNLVFRVLFFLEMK